MNDIDRFMAKVRKAGECWIWAGALNHKGYGMFWSGGSRAAHRVSYELFVGEIPPGAQVDHHICFDHACVRPTHLRLVTHKQNAENRVGAQKNNHSTGVRGVYRVPSGRYSAIVTHNQKQHYLGRFDSIDDAEDAAREKRLQLFTHNERDRVV